MEDLTVEKAKEDWGDLVNLVKKEVKFYLKTEVNEDKREEYGSQFLSSANDILGLEERLKRRLESVDRDGDLNIYSNEDGGKLVGTVDRFIWNLWMKEESNGDQDDDEEEQAQVIFSRRTTTKSSELALKSIINYMYAGDFKTDKLPVLFEIAENRDNRNTQIRQHAQQQILSMFNLEVLMTLWNLENYQDSLKNDLLVLHSLGFILEYPSDVFRCNGEDGVFLIPAELLQKLLPSNIEIVLEELKGTGIRQWRTKTRVGKKGVCYIDIDHIDFSEFLFRWALQNHALNDVTQAVSTEIDGLCYSELEEMLGDLTDLLEPEYFDVSSANDPKWKRDISTEHFVKGVFYYSVMVLNKGMEDLRKQTTVIYPFAMENPPSSKFHKRSISFGSPPPAKKFKSAESVDLPKQLAICNEGWNQKQVNPIIKLLGKEYEKMRFVDVEFKVQDQSIKANSFLLSLWSSAFAEKENRQRVNTKCFSFGNVKFEDIKEFVKVIYTGKMSPEANVLVFMKLATILQIPAFIRLGIEKLRMIAITPSNCFLRYLAERMNGDIENAADVKTYIAENLKDALYEGELEILADKSFLMELLQLDREEEVEYDLLKRIYSWCLLHNDNQATARNVMRDVFCPLMNISRLNELQIASVTNETLIGLVAALRYATERGKCLGKQK